jgi:hypothetical protein
MRKCPKQQYWSKYLKMVQIESGNEQNDATDMARDLGLVFDQIGVGMNLDQAWC